MSSSNPTGLVRVTITPKTLQGMRELVKVQDDKKRAIKQLDASGGFNKTTKGWFGIVLKNVDTKLVKEVNEENPWLWVYEFMDSVFVEDAGILEGLREVIMLRTSGEEVYLNPRQSRALQKFYEEQRKK